MAVLGLDLGTSALKALLVGDDGRVLATASEPCAVDTPRRGWAEAAPESWLAAAGRATTTALAAARDAGGREPVRAVGLSGQMHGVVLCDAAGAPRRPALLWPDGRAIDELGLWRALSPGRRAALANPLWPGMAGPMLAWLLKAEPEVMAGAAWALQPKDWLRLMLCGQAATEPTDASATLLWDLPADRWAFDVAEAAGIDPGLLAPVMESSAAAGELLPTPAGQLGLPAGLPVHAGAADAAAALLGAGVDRPGRRVLNIGTGAQLATVVDSPQAGPRPTTHRYRSVHDWYAMAAVQNAGLALGWVLELLGVDWEDAEAEAFANAAPDDHRTPLFLPQLTGERTPLLDPHARGAFLGLGLAHDRADVLRAAYAGVAHAIRHARDALDGEVTQPPKHEELCLLGGGSLRPGYRQLVADTLGEPLLLLDVADASARGAAHLAGAHVDDPQPVGRVEPRRAPAAAADERHQRWLKALRPDPG